MTIDQIIAPTVTVDGHAIDYSGLPEQCRRPMELYLELGVRPGSFLHACLTNVLSEALAQASSESDLRMVVRWLRWQAPAQCHGSTERVREWIAVREAI